jgi:hypothetical protein
MAVIKACVEQNEKVLMQAGSCQWPRITREQDDGVMATHFGYVWQPNHPATELAIAEHRIPEMHCWVVLPERRELIDMSSSSFPEQCMKLIGKDWPGIKPPDYLWCSFDNLPKDVIYRADREAIDLAIIVARNILEQIYISTGIKELQKQRAKEDLREGIREINLIPGV